METNLEMNPNERRISDAIGDVIREAFDEGMTEQVVSILGTHLMAVFGHLDKHLPEGYSFDRKLAAQHLREMAGYVEVGQFETPEIQ